MSETTFEREVLDRLTKIEAKLDSFDAAKKKTYDNENEIIRLTGDIDGMKERIGQLEDSNKWLARTLAAAIITAVVGVVFVLIRMGAGI
ncbi:MAG: hemolysin XhlA family protein [Lachnospiraceae bacterium]